MLTAVSIHAFHLLNGAKAWIPTCVGMTSLDRSRRVCIKGRLTLGHQIFIPTRNTSIFFS